MNIIELFLILSVCLNGWLFMSLWLLHRRNEENYARLMRLLDPPAPGTPAPHRRAYDEPLGSANELLLVLAAVGAAVLVVIVFTVG